MGQMAVGAPPVLRLCLARVCVCPVCVPQDANGSPLVVFSLGQLDVNKKKVGCVLHGFYDGAVTQPQI